MRSVQLGHSDLMVTIACLGTMTWGEQNTELEVRVNLRTPRTLPHLPARLTQTSPLCLVQAFEQLDYAVHQAGINFIDTAELSLPLLYAPLAPFLPSRRDPTSVVAVSSSCLGPQSGGREARRSRAARVQVPCSSEARYCGADRDDDRQVACAGRTRATQKDHPCQQGCRVQQGPWLPRGEQKGDPW